MPSANDELRDQAIRRAIFLERFKEGERRRLIAVYRSLEQDLVARILQADFGDKSAQERLIRAGVLLDDINRRLIDFGQQERAETRRILDKLAALEAQALADAVQSVAGGAVSVVVPSAAQVHAAIIARPLQGAHLREWTDGLHEGARARVAAAIRRGVVEGISVPELASRIREATRTSARKAIMVARTAFTHVGAVARHETMRANADVVKRYQWVSTLDTRTSDICQDLDGQVFEVDRGPLPPAHPNCRSTIVPLLPTWRQLGINIDEAPPGTRASMDGQVPATMTYREWLKTQPPEVQEEVMGRSRAGRWRRGEDVDPADQSQRPLNL